MVERRRRRFAPCSGGRCSPSRGTPWRLMAWSSAERPERRSSTDPGNGRLDRGRRPRDRASSSVRWNTPPRIRADSRYAALRPLALSPVRRPLAARPLRRALRASRSHGLRLRPPAQRERVVRRRCRGRCAESAITASRPTRSAFDRCGSDCASRLSTRFAAAIVNFASRIQPSHFRPNGNVILAHVRQIGNGRSNAIDERRRPLLDTGIARIPRVRRLRRSSEPETLHAQMHSTCSSAHRRDATPFQSR